MVALSFMTALHICNIATHVSTSLLLEASALATEEPTHSLSSNTNGCLQFLSFSPAIKYWVTTFNVDFSRLLLTAT